MVLPGREVLPEEQRHLLLGNHFRAGSFPLHQKSINAKLLVLRGPKLNSKCSLTQLRGTITPAVVLLASQWQTQARVPPVATLASCCHHSILSLLSCYNKVIQDCRVSAMTFPYSCIGVCNSYMFVTPNKRGHSDPYVPANTQCGSCKPFASPEISPALLPWPCSSL